MTFLTWLTRLTRLLSGLCILLLCNCAGSETGNPSMTRTVSMALVLKSSDSSVAQNCPLGDACTGSGLKLQSVWLATEYVNVASCVGQDDSSLPPNAWDLLNPVATTFSTQIAEFCGFQFLTRLADAGLGTIPNELTGASIWLRATRADSTTVDIRSPAIISVGKVDPSQPLRGTKLVVALDAAAWLNSIDVNSLTADADGVVRVSSASNPLVLQQVDQQTANNALLRDEEDDDGVTGD